MKIRLLQPDAVGKSDFLEFVARSLDESVLAAVKSEKENLVLWGAAKVGKSSAIVARTLELLSRGVKAENILVIAFGRERANELRDQIVTSAQIDLYEPMVRTFHALAFSILNEKLSPDDKSFVLMSGAEQEALIRQMLDSEISKVIWPAELQAALSTRGFVKELREIISRALELNISPKELAEMGKRNKENWWSEVSAFYQEYLEIVAIAPTHVTQSPIKVDPSAIVQEAIYLLKNNSELKKRFSNRFQYILVDDFQESDAAQRELLQELSAKSLFITADPDSAVGRFRGADPDGVRDWINRRNNFSEYLASKPLGLAPAIQDLDNVIVSRMRGASKAPARIPLKTELLKAEGAGNELDSAALDFVHLESESDAAYYIAQQFRKAHLLEQVPWSKMAVILRSPSGLVDILNRAFLEYEIPISIDPTAVALSQNPAIKPLLQILELAVDQDKLSENNWSQIEEVLRSVYCGADSINLRQMRLWLSRENDRNLNDEIVNTTKLLIEVIKDPESVNEADKFAPLVNLGNLIKSAKKALRNQGDVYDALWAIWDGAVDSSKRKIADSWRETALAGGVSGLKADRDLDSVIYLFQSTIRYLTRNQKSTPKEFLEYLFSQDVPSDAVVNFAKRDEVVEVLTVHSAMGREWDQVALFGLQDGIWPNLKVRGSLLGSDRLVESMRSQLTARDQILAAQSDALVDDERRLLHVAITRAKAKLIISTYTQEGSQPSRYASEICEAIFDKEISEIDSTEIETPLTLSALIATSRRKLQNSESAELAARILATLSNLGVRGSNPKSWLGVRDLSSDDPILATDENVFLSPSSLDAINKCALAWFLQKNGGRDGDSTPQLVGTAIHALAAELVEHPERSEADFGELIEKNFALLTQEKGWVKDYELKQAKAVIRRLFEWLKFDQEQGRKLVAAERSFRLVVGRAILSGTVDRIEVDREGKLFIVDLKTGKKWTKNEINESLQIATYQLAAESSAWVEEKDRQDLPTKVSGGALAFFKEDYSAAKTYEATLPGLNEVTREALNEQITQVGEAISGNELVATVGKNCNSCVVKASCPLQPEGRWVIG